MEGVSGAGVADVVYRRMVVGGKTPSGGSNCGEGCGREIVEIIHLGGKHLFLVRRIT